MIFEPPRIKRTTVRNWRDAKPSQYNYLCWLGPWWKPEYVTITVHIRKPGG